MLLEINYYEATVISQWARDEGRRNVARMVRVSTPFMAEHEREYNTAAMWRDNAVRAFALKDRVDQLRCEYEGNE